MSEQGGERRLLRAATFESVGFVIRYVLRFGRSLVLTRLLFEEAFGVMSLLGALQVGLAMLSDVGIAAAIVQNPRSEDEDFLNTAWTMQVVRGMGLTVLALLAAYPLALFYDDPTQADLLPSFLVLVPVMALGILIQGFESTALLTMRRRMEVGRIVGIELSVAIITAVVALSWAAIAPSIWVLLITSLLATTLTTVGSHVVSIGYRNRFRWERRSAEEITQFGKWILGSTALEFVLGQLDRIVLGALLGMKLLGIYAVATTLSGALSEAVSRLTHGVVYPALSREHERDKSAVGEAYYRTRRVMDPLTMVGTGGLVVLAPHVIQILYDDRYLEAGWILQWLAFRVALTSLHLPCETALFATGQSRYGFYRNAARAVSLLTMLPVGWWLAGPGGLIASLALSELSAFAVLWPAAWRSGILRPAREGLAVAMFLGGAAIGLAVDVLAGPWLSQF